MNTIDDGYYQLAEFLKQTHSIKTELKIITHRRPNRNEWYAEGFTSSVERAKPKYVLKLYWGEPHTEESWLEAKEKGETQPPFEHGFLTEYTRDSLFNLSGRSKRDCIRYNPVERYTVIKLTKTEHKRLKNNGL